MKRLIMMVAIAIIALQNVQAQQFEPTTTWPYIYNDFTSGTLHMLIGSDKDGQYNVCLAGNTLHFIDGDLVKAANMNEVLSVKIGKDIYENVNGELMKVLAKSDNGVVVNEITVDMAKLNSTGAAYGSSSNSVGTMALSSLEGIGGSRTNMNHMELKAEKEDGKILPLIEKKYFIVKGHTIFAGKKDVMDVDGLDKAAATTFFKSNKIKWSDPQSLIKVVDFLSTQIK